MTQFWSCFLLILTNPSPQPAKAGNAVVQGEYIIGQTSSKSNRLKHIAAVKTQHSAGENLSVPPL